MYFVLYVLYTLQGYNSSREEQALGMITYKQKLAFDTTRRAREAKQLTTMGKLKASFIKLRSKVSIVVNV